MRLKNISRAAMAAFFLTIFSASLSAAPKADLWPRWEAQNAASMLAVDHTDWTVFLERNLGPVPASGARRLDYGRVSAADKALLNDYLTKLQSVPVSSLSRAEQLAYWINLYNSATVKIVLDKYPVASIRDIKFGASFSAAGPWQAKLLRVEDEELALNDIEHRILRPIWKDPRIHYAVNCASLGCPNLQGEAFTALNADALLERGAKEYINDPRGVAFVKGKLILSSIYSWFADDFGPDRAALFAHLLRYAEGDTASRLSSYSGPVAYAYDWSLNAP